MNGSGKPSTHYNTVTITAVKSFMVLVLADEGQKKEVMLHSKMKEKNEKMDLLGNLVFVSNVCFRFQQH